MRVFDINTSADTYSAFGPIIPLGSHPLPRKRECIQTIRSLCYAWQADLALSALSLTPSKCSYTLSVALSRVMQNNLPATTCIH